MFAQKSPCAGARPVNRSSARSPQQDPVTSAPSTPDMYRGEVTCYSRALQSYAEAAEEPLDSVMDSCQLVSTGPTEEEILNDMYNFYILQLPQEYMDDRVGFEEHLQMLKEQMQRMEQWEKNQQRQYQVPEQFYLRYNIPEFQNRQFHQVQDDRSPPSEYDQLPEASEQNTSTKKVKYSEDVPMAPLKNEHESDVPHQVPTSPSGRGVPCAVPTTTPDMEVLWQVPKTPLPMAVENQVTTSPPGMVFHEGAMNLLEDEQGMANTSSENNFLDSFMEEISVEL